MVSIFLFIYILLCIVGIYKKRNIFIYIALVAVCIIISGYNYDNPDYEPYSNRYGWAEYPREFNILSLLDISYRVLQAFCKDIGIAEYQDFRIVLSAIIYIMLALVINKYCVYRNLFFIIYTVAYLPLDLIQIRNFLAFVILLPFLLLLNRPSFKNTLKYIGGVIIAFTIHFSSAIFSIFAILGIKTQKMRYTFVLLIIVVLIVLYPIASVVVGASAAADHVDNYARASFLGGLFMASFVVANYFVMTNLPCKLSSNSATSVLSVKSHSVNFQFIKGLNFLLLALIPLVFVTGSALLRVFRFISLLNIVYIINTLYNANNSITRHQIYLILGMYAFYFAIFFIYTDSSVVHSIFVNSLIE